MHQQQQSFFFSHIDHPFLCARNSPGKMRRHFLKFLEPSSSLTCVSGFISGFPRVLELLFVKCYLSCTVDGNKGIFMNLDFTSVASNNYYLYNCQPIFCLFLPAALFYLKFIIILWNLIRLLLTNKKIEHRSSRFSQSHIIQLNTESRKIPSNP
jgi:hypothetical protein